MYLTYWRREMKLFQCQNCAQVLYFENVRCECCGAALGYLSEATTLTPLQAVGDAWRAVADAETFYRYCANFEYGVCNWLVAAEDTETRCTACRLNRTIPGLDTPRALELWGNMEVAKHRLVYSLLQLKLPLMSKTDDPENGLTFDFLSDPGEHGYAPAVMTGHASGVITLNIAEADPVRREEARANMHEPYRTLLGHFRHEIGHFYWDRLIAPRAEDLAAFRELFGDETPSYEDALRLYYEHGARGDWQNAHISAYATAHPWEDWAETWAHYLHMVDTLETAHAFGLRVKARVEQPATLQATALDPHSERPFKSLMNSWTPVAAAVNSLNRSMGQPDLYPFVISSPAMEKLSFVHDIITADGGAKSEAQGGVSLQ